MNIANDGGKTFGPPVDVMANFTVNSADQAAVALADSCNTVPTGTAIPTIAAGNPGEVDVSWLRTNEIEPTNALGKFLQGGCAGPGNGNPDFYPPTCNWNLYAGQSLNLTAPTGIATWTTGTVTTTPMHVGDICNLGIFCLDPNSDRNLLDFNSEVVDRPPASRTSPTRTTTR